MKKRKKVQENNQELTDQEKEERESLKEVVEDYF